MEPAWCAGMCRDGSGSSSQPALLRDEREPRRLWGVGHPALAEWAPALGGRRADAGVLPAGVWEDKGMASAFSAKSLGGCSERRGRRRCGMFLLG